MTSGEFKDAQLPIKNRSLHDMGNHFVGSAAFGQLLPIYCKYVMPREKVSYRPNVLVQSPAFATITFGRIRVTQHSFFVPARILWDEFWDFINGGSTGRQLFSPPYVWNGDLTCMCACEKTSFDMLDYLPTGTSGTSWGDVFGSQTPLERGYFSGLITSLGLHPFHRIVSGTTTFEASDNYAQLPINLLPFRAYQRVWWDWYRDSTLVPESLKSNFIHTNGGRQTFLYGESASTSWSSVPDMYAAVDCSTRHVCYEKDYFTTARLDPQLGTVSLVPVDIASTSLNPELVAGATAGVQYVKYGSNGIGTGNTSFTPSAAATSVIGQFAIEQFRAANAQQRFLERSNVTGTRPMAQLLARFGASPSASRLDMAEFIGGEERYLDPKQVISSARTSEGELADRAAYGKLFFNTEKPQEYTAEEHGYFISVLSITPVAEYCDGIDRMFSAMTKEDFYLEEYANLGFEPITLKEFNNDVLMDDGSDIDSPETVFGFVPRYSWLKWKRSVLAGDFVRMNTAATSDQWHTFRRFQGKQSPYLDPTFVEVRANDGWNNWNRLFTNTTNDYDPFNLDIWNECNCVMPISGFADPALATVYEQSGNKIKIPYGGIRL